MRKLMWFTIGFAGACALGEYLGFWYFVGSAAAVCGLLLLWKEQRARCFAAGLGLAVGFAWFVGFEMVYTAPVRALDGETVGLDVNITSYSWETDFGSAADGFVWIGGKPYKMRLYLNEPTELQPGTVVSCPVKLHITTEGGAHEPTFHRSNGILLLGYQRDEAGFSYTDTTKHRYFAAHLRQRLTELIDSSFPGDAAGFAKALLLGDKTGISYQMRSDFSLSGISHIVAVSGLHMSILFALLCGILGKRRFVLAFAGIPAVVVFMAVAGFAPSVTRAGIMQILMILALCLKREYDPPTALSFSVLIMLMGNPLVISSVGFQLSVMSVAGIFLFHERLYKWLTHRVPEGKRGPARKLRRWFCSGVSVTLSAQVMTVPLVAIYFGTVSLIGVVANLAVLWVISAIFYGVAAVCLLGFVWMPGAVALAWVTAWPIRFVIATAGALASVPLAAVFTKSVYIVIWLVLSYGLLGILVLGPKKRPGFCFGLSLLGLCGALMLSWWLPLKDDHRVTALDVGQGQCIVLQSDGRTYVVDCGGDHAGDAADSCANYLLSMGISRIDGLIVTHYDFDHAGGIPHLFHRIRADAVYLPAFDGEQIDGILDSSRQAEVIFVRDDTVIRDGSLRLTLFAPETGTNEGQNGIAVLFQTAKCDTLILGDRSAASERRLVQQGCLPKLEVLVVGHHGAKSATSLELISAAAPETAIISVGRDNGYNHPNDQVLALLELAGCEILRTDEMGDILYRR